MAGWTKLHCSRSSLGDMMKWTEEGVTPLKYKMYLNQVSINIIVTGVCTSGVNQSPAVGSADEH